jgi:hypothetical protein
MNRSDRWLTTLAWLALTFSFVMLFVLLGAGIRMIVTPCLPCAGW